MDIEQKKVTADNIPSHACRLYIQLYCDRKGEKNKATIQDAKKSWISLSLAKKKLFYKTCADRNLLNYAHGLCKTETFLKQKKTRKLFNKLNTSNSVEDCDQRLEPNAKIPFINNSNLTEKESRLSVENEFIVDDKNQNNTNSEVLNENKVISNEIDQETDVASPLCDTTPSNEINKTRIEESLEILSNTDSNQQGTAVPLGEPAPPTVMFGKDLYEMIKGPEDKDWKDIGAKEVQQYNRAVLIIKREYIKKYTTYLESLSQQQLFDHYMKTLH